MLQKYYPLYFTLLKKVVKKAELPEGFADVIADWEDSNTEPQNADGAERDYYSSGSIPYLAADMAFTDVSELRLLRLEDLDNDAKEAALKRFSSMVIALPFKQTTINPNTASFTLLSALGLNSEQITTLKEKRRVLILRRCRTRMFTREVGCKLGLLKSTLEHVFVGDGDLAPGFQSHCFFFLRLLRSNPSQTCCSWKRPSGVHLRRAAVARAFVSGPPD